VLGRETHQEAGGLPVLGDDNLFALCEAQILRQIVFHFRQSYLFHRFHDVLPATHRLRLLAKWQVVPDGNHVGSFTRIAKMPQTSNSASNAEPLRRAGLSGQAELVTGPLVPIRSPRSPPERRFTRSDGAFDGAHEPNDRNMRSLMDLQSLVCDAFHAKRGV